MAPKVDKDPPPEWLEAIKQTVATAIDEQFEALPDRVKELVEPLLAPIAG